MSNVPEMPNQPPLTFCSSRWITEAPPWLNRLAQRLLTNLLGWAVAGITWTLLNGGDRHEMAKNFSFMLMIFTAAIYAVALVVYRVKQASHHRSG